MERTHHDEKERTRPQNQGDKMGNWEKFAPISREQTTNLKNDTQAHMDLWHRSVGLRQ